MDFLRWIFLAVFVLGTIAFIVFLVLSAKNSRVVHILSMLFAYAAAATFAVGFALLTKTHTAWTEIVATNEQAAEQAKDDLDTVLYGDVSPEFSDESLVGLKGDLNREVFGRGRVWRGATGIVQPNGGIVVTLPESNEELPEGATPPANAIEPQSPIFAFLEGPLQSESNPEIAGMNVPVRYLGEFVVTNASPNQVELSPVLVFFDPSEAQGQIGLALYEQMPGDHNERTPEDGYDLIVQLDDPNADPVVVRQVLVQEVFPALDPANLLAVMQNEASRLESELGVDPALFDLSSPEAQRAMQARIEYLLDRYQFDGKTLGQIDAIIGQLPNRINETFVIPPEEEWLEVEFLQDFTIEVDAPNSDDPATDIRRSAVTQGFYDSQGKGISADLRLEGPVEFKAGDTVMVDRITAEDGYVDENGSLIESLVGQGIVQINERYFFRKLNDYQTLFAESNLKGENLVRDIRREQHLVASLTKARVETEKQIDLRMEEQNQLTQDIEKLQNDVMVANNHLMKLTDLLAARREKINALFVATQGLAQRKAELEAALVEQINQQTEAAVTQ